MTSSFVIQDGSSLRFSRTSEKERVLLTNLVLESVFNKMVVSLGERVSQDGLEVDYLVAGGEDKSIMAASSHMGETAKASDFFVMVVVVQGRKED
eukprot:7774555-Ditylum_brightwellii.AAC.1